MRLVGKRVERLNRYGDDLCIELKEKGTMRISPALKSRMGIPDSGNKVGFAYPDSDEDVQMVMMYVAPDGNGVAVNNQGVLNNTPHNRDLRSHYEESGTEDVKLFVAEQYIEIDGFEGYKFFKIKSKVQIHASDSEEFFGDPAENDDLTIEDTNDEIFGEDDQKFQEEVNDIEEVEEVLVHGEEASKNEDLDFIEEEKVDSVAAVEADPDDMW